MCTLRLPRADQKRSEGGEGDTPWLSFFPDAAISFYTFLLVLVTLGLVVIGIIQAVVSKQAADTGERALVAGQRAFVSVSFRPNANRDIKTGNVNFWIITPVWINAGNTPTRDLLNHTNIYLAEAPLPSDWKFPDYWAKETPQEERVPTLLSAGPKAPVDGQFVSVPIEGMEDVAAQRKFLYVWGWATYRDVLPGTEPHVTRFAVQVVVGGDPRNPDKTSFQWTLLNTYNCSDEECDHRGYPAAWMAEQLSAL